MMAGRLKYYSPRWTKTKVVVGVVGAVLVLTILYYLGDSQWERKHLRISYLSTKTYNQTCWRIERLVTTHEGNQDNHTLIRQLVNEFNVSELWPGFSEKLYTPGRGILEEMKTNEENLLLYWIVLRKQETRDVRVNWIQVYGQNPQWYYTQTCVSELDILYWKEEITEPAPFQKHKCHQLIPVPTTFMGNLNLTCDENLTRANDPGLEKINQSGVSAEILRNHTVRINPWKPPRIVRQLTTQLHKCLKEKAFKLDPCMWSLGPIVCNAESYLVLSQVTEMGLAGTVFYEEWLNDTLPWIWKRRVAHLTASEQAITSITGDHLFGPTHTEMYVQKIPTPEELWAAPKGDFAKIDECAVSRMFDELNNTDFEMGGGTKYDWVSPRCEIIQVSAWESGYWTYDCTRLKKHKTLKGALQAWVEHFHRVTEKTWWGLQENEVKAWVLPCLTLTTNYWVKYQYLSTVYSLGDGLVEWYGWTGFRPRVTVTPRPWKMICDKTNSTCTIELSRKPCGEIPGWGTTCEQWYDGGYNTFKQGAKWVKNNIYMHDNLTRVKRKDHMWQRATDLWNRGCAKALLGPMAERRHIASQIVPFVGRAEQTRMEGHAFRKSLCDGKEEEGYDWLGPNNMFNNGTCEQPQEVWLKCGNHDCTVTELFGRTILEGIVEIPEEVVGKIEEGAFTVVNQLSDVMKKMVPYMFVGLGLLIVVLLTWGSLKGVFQSACRRRKRETTPLTREELRLLLEEEGFNPL